MILVDTSVWIDHLRVADRHLAGLQSPVVEHDDVLAFVEAHALMGSGLGWVDVHLLASAILAGERFWTA